MRYSVVDGLRVRYFDDEAVVFDPLSWDAHLLNPAAMAVLEFLLEAPRPGSDIASLLEEALRPGEQAQADVHARRLIDHLLVLGLIRAV